MCLSKNRAEEMGKGGGEEKVDLTSECVCVCVQRPSVPCCYTSVNKWRAAFFFSSCAQKQAVAGVTAIRQLVFYLNLWFRVFMSSTVL